jgi:hypothetical protein
MGLCSMLERAPVVASLPLTSPLTTPSPGEAETRGRSWVLYDTCNTFCTIHIRNVLTATNEWASVVCGTVQVVQSIFLPLPCPYIHGEKTPPARRHDIAHSEYWLSGAECEFLRSVRICGTVQVVNLTSVVRGLYDTYNMSRTIHILNVLNAKNEWASRVCRTVQVVQSTFLPFPWSVYPWREDPTSVASLPLTSPLIMPSTGEAEPRESSCVLYDTYNTFCTIHIRNVLNATNELALAPAQVFVSARKVELFEDPTSIRTRLITWSAPVITFSYTRLLTHAEYGRSGAERKFLHSVRCL